MTSKYIYDSAFQNMAASGSAYAARRIISVVHTILPVRSVADIGCARGTWLREWQAQTVADVIGVDGDYVERSKLEIDPGRFIVRDLAQPFELGRQFDLVQSLEVAEHLPPERAASFIADLVSLAPVVLFSAAAPGQGGENHLNERTGAYWQALFRRHDYVAIDCLRPILAREKRIPSWYRYNLVLYVRHDHLEHIAAFARLFQLEGGDEVRDVSPLPYRLRKRVIRLLPQAVCNRLAQWNARRFPES
jgi:SAM-dependent methyltransferase